MKTKTRNNVLFGAFALIAIIALWLAPKASAATVPIDKVTGTQITLPVYAANDTLEITGAALDVADWTILRNNTTLDFHLFLNNPAMTTIDTNIAAASIMMGNTHILSLKAPHITSIADGGDVGGTYFGAFAFCTNLKSVDMPNATFIGKSAFDTCDLLKNVSLPAATSIGTYAFYDCALEGISLPAATSIGMGTFQSCAALESVFLPAATNIGQQAFYNCTALESISLPSAKAIGQEAFEDCVALTSVSLPAVTSIGQEAFDSCVALTEYIFGANPPTTLGVNIGSGSYATPKYYHSGNAAAWVGFTLDATNHTPTLVDTTATPPTTTTTTTGASTNYIYNFFQLPTAENNYTAIVDVDISKFTDVYVNGSLISRDNYAASSGSTIVKLNANYINTLKAGEHTIGLWFSDGIASGTFNVAGANSGILGIGVYPYGGGMQPYTPSVTPSKMIAEEKLDEGVFEQEIFDSEEIANSASPGMLIIGTMLAMFGASFVIVRKRNSR